MWILNIYYEHSQSGFWGFGGMIGIMRPEMNCDPNAAL